jgi:hypothetical protein
MMCVNQIEHAYGLRLAVGLAVGDRLRLAVGLAVGLSVGDVMLQ